MNILHVSAECYPVAKAGGLGDVAGALPKYLQLAGNRSSLIMPMYRTKFLHSHEWEPVHEGNANLADYFFNYTIIRERNNVLGFDLYLVDIFGLLDRPGIYGYNDDPQRFTAFQIAVVDWLSSWNHHPNVVNVHDHHAALIPFMMQHCYKYMHLRHIPTVLTIHNAQYQGWMGWDSATMLPAYDSWKTGMLDWQGKINPLASGIRCASKVTTVSDSYLHELKQSSNGLEKLFEYEKGKCVGILNGIDAEVWNPQTDRYLRNRYRSENAAEGKQKSKLELCEVFGLSPQKPLIVFIGRLVGDKAADLLPGVIGDSFYHLGRHMNFLILGSGDPNIEARLNQMTAYAQNDYACYIGYNEALSHLMYAGADFLLMPSRVEPCGLNQLYAMRYGTVPIVRNTGGLRDTVKDIGEQDGYGIVFNDASMGDITHAVWRALQIYPQQHYMDGIRSHMMRLDYSWETCVGKYLEIYQSIN